MITEEQYEVALNELEEAHMIIHAYHRQIKVAYLLPNGHVLAFNFKDELIYELQGPHDPEKLKTYCTDETIFYGFPKES